MFLTDIDISQWVIASGVLILLLILFANALKFYMQRQPQTALGMKKRRLKIVETLYLDPRNKVSIVKFDDTEVVLGLSANGISIIGSQEAVDQTPIDTECSKDSMSGIGFLKRFIKGSCPEDEVILKKNIKPKPKAKPTSKTTNTKIKKKK